MFLTDFSQTFPLTLTNQILFPIALQLLYPTKLIYLLIFVKRLLLILCSIYVTPLLVQIYYLSGSLRIALLNCQLLYAAYLMNPYLRA